MKKIHEKNLKVYLNEILSKNENVLSTIEHS